METEGIVLDLQTIVKLREDFSKLSVELHRRLDETNASIDQVAKTWQDSNFQKFYETFKQDEERLEPLFRRVAIFDTDFLAEIEWNLREYLEINNTY